MRRIRTEIEKMFEEFEEAMLRPLADMTHGYLTPLYEVRETEREVIVYVDLPGVYRKEDIDVSVSENKLVVEARMARPVCFGEIPFYESCRFERYYLEIRLPTPVIPERASASFKGKVLEIRLPKRITRYRVKVE